MDHATERRADTGFGTRPFEQDAIEDFDLIEAVALRLEKLSALIDGCLDNGIVICGKRYQLDAAGADGLCAESAGFVAKTSRP